ncbi:MAG: DUF4412 domain-containing protein [Holophagales bacterium]|jgi:hypothetical protein|nr:DUF4412 domain-containing protein [Holophagales bacterium]
MKKHILAALAIAALAGQLFAGDLKITYKQETKAMSTTQKSESVHYYSSRFQRVNNNQEKLDSLTDYKDLTTYQIDHKKKTISKFTLDDMLKAMKLVSAQAQNVDPQTKKMMEAMFGSGGTVKTEKLGKATVAGRTCDKWKITMGKTAYVISADPSLDVPIPKSAWEKGSQLKDAMSIAAPGMGDMIAKLLPEMAKIKGVQLKTETEMSMMGITTKTLLEATKIETGSIPASMFELPKGYKMEDAGKKMVEELQKSAKKK